MMLVGLSGTHVAAKSFQTAIDQGAQSVQSTLSVQSVRAANTADSKVVAQSMAKKAVRRAEDLLVAMTATMLEAKLEVKIAVNSAAMTAVRSKVHAKEAPQLVAHAAVVLVVALAAVVVAVRKF
jgi:hypothetical protein